MLLRAFISFSARLSRTGFQAVPVRTRPYTSTDVDADIWLLQLAARKNVLLSRSVT